MAYFAVLQTSSAQDLLAEKIAKWDFQRAEDTNLDLKPDGWQRLVDRDHPDYIDLTIAPRDEEAGMAAKKAQATLAKMMYRLETGDFDSNYVAEVIPPSLANFMDRYLLHMCLSVEMDGGAAERVSPLFPVDARFAYSLRGDVRTENLKGHQASIELQLLDEQLNVVEVLRTDAVSDTNEWKRYETQGASNPSSLLKWGRVHVKVEPLRKAMHFVGRASFDSIEVFRLPRLSLTTQLPQHIAEAGVPFEVVCTGMGLRRANADVKFSLHDSEDKLLKSESVVLQSLQFAQTPEARLAQDGSKPPPAYMVKKSTRVYDGAAAWEVTLDSPGLYRVRVDLGNRNTDARHREILVAVMPPQRSFNAGPFAWSIRDFDTTVQPEDLPDLVRNYGASRVKFPVWFDADDTATATRLSKLIDKLQGVGTESIGRLDKPPAAFSMNDRDQSIILAMLRNAENWEQMVAPVLTRLGMKLTWYQLGADDDLSLMSHEDVTELMRQTRRRMQTYSQELRLVLNWTWLTPEPPNPAGSWNATHRRETPALSAAELESYLAQENQVGETWINFNPLSQSEYSLLDRVRDFVSRAVAIKKTNVRSAFLVDPFDAEKGIFQPDGSVGEMLLPWHTIVSNIGDASYLGSIQLPEGSENHIFQSEGQGMMLVWNNTPTTELLYVGEDVSAIDIWGRDVDVKTIQNRQNGAMEQALPVGKWPLLVRGVDVKVVKWRQSFDVTVTHLASTLGVSQLVPLVLENSFESTASGKVSLHSPTLVGKRKSELRFEVGTQGKHQRQMQLTVRNDASAGKHNLRFDFEVTAAKPYKFSVYREIALGLGDVEFIWDASPVGGDRLELRLELLNHTDADVSFDCKIFPSGRAYERMTVINASPGSTQQQRVVMKPTTPEGQIWIRCEQIGTGRILNYRVKP
ncbi:MAG: hypothetical protein Aurels2KO_32030 [Aureliella sp.]